MISADWKKTAAVAGLVVGVLGALPVVGNPFCCCLWAIGGGALAVRAAIPSSPTALTNAEGARIGVGVGIIAAVTFLMLALIFSLSDALNNISLGFLERTAGNINNAEVQDQLRRVIEEARQLTPVQRAIRGLPVFVMQGVVTLALAAVGGLLGVVLFEKRKPAAPPLA
jgi:hypothetical protein